MMLAMSFTTTWAKHGVRASARPPFGGTVADLSVAGGANCPFAISSPTSSSKDAQMSGADAPTLQMSPAGPKADHRSCCIEVRSSRESRLSLEASPTHSLAATRTQAMSASGRKPGCPTTTCKLQGRAASPTHLWTRRRPVPAVVPASSLTASHRASCSRSAGTAKKKHWLPSAPKICQRPARPAPQCHSEQKRASAPIALEALQ